MALDTDLDRLRHLPDVPGQLKRAYWWLRETFFTRQPPENPAVVVEMRPAEAEALFGRHFFEPGWETSYTYHGEVLNLRRVRHVADETLEWWQVHVRGYCRRRDRADGTCRELELTAHFEPEPVEHPDAHVSGRFVDVARGNDVMVDLLDEHGVAYDRVGDWPAAT